MIAVASWAQYPPSHDPSTMVRNVDGRYWIFTTGNGIWAMSSSNANFSDWRPEPTPFAPGTWPGWISNYVEGFNGFFWAPDVIKVGNTYFLYYSCAGNGAPAAIGVATATNLAGPWTDRGMVVAGNNAIDPALLLDNGRLWMSWGNWQSGIDIIELSTSTGKPISGSTHLVSGQVEGPGLYKSGGYYYLFYQRGLCCNGVNSGYYMVVARSTNITGPYTGERVFLPNRNGNIIGPGHFGYGQGRLTYHFYDGNDSGNAKLMVRSDFGVANGWPYVGTPPSGPGVPSGTYRITPRHSGKALDVVDCGNTDGTNVQQWSWLNNNCQKWNFTQMGGGYRISPVSAPNQALDLEDCNNANATNVRLWSWLNNDCQKWELVNRGSGYYSIRSVATGKCLDVNSFSTDDGANVFQYDCNSQSTNQQFRMDAVSASLQTVRLDQGEVSSEPSGVYPNPVIDQVNILLPKASEGVTTLKIMDVEGKLMKQESFKGKAHQIDVSALPKGVYILSYENIDGSYVKKISKQ
ncbi:family 43 glycosylhydrolase [Fulvivirga sediminis]|uniref:Family 43 glycosylhydrolase n=1 Tax=Fulvivirga sediminis TaxID=2803949 RepID=A0A937F5E9_9BACT|nr:family 43 glycosylhydrolase [Fulvivirga sediminis]MBL3656090.1 family 43 glycosylhydrolase [Fulvivirga sediminis]